MNSLSVIRQDIMSSMQAVRSETNGVYAINGELGRTYRKRLVNHSLQACGYVRQKHVLAPIPESRRPVLEQLELSVNSHVCGVEAVVKAYYTEQFGQQHSSSHSTST